jgi:hypothetical protein
MAPKKKKSVFATMSTAAVVAVEVEKIEEEEPVKEPTPPSSREPSPDSQGFATDDSMRVET